jgi:hypothetical protein
MPKKTLFTPKAIRALSVSETLFIPKVLAVLNGLSVEEVIATIPGFISYDGQQRSLVFSREIADKIQKDHGHIVPENLIINAHDWDYVIRNVNGNPDKINLIKQTSGDGFIRIGANRDNGFYIVTHYENREGKGQKLKNLLLQGDFLDSSGRTQIPSFATAPEGAASQPVGDSAFWRQND